MCFIEINEKTKMEGGCLEREAPARASKNYWFEENCLEMAEASCLPQREGSCLEKVASHLAVVTSFPPRKLPLRVSRKVASRRQHRKSKWLLALLRKSCLKGELPLLRVSRRAASRTIVLTYPNKQ